MLKSEGRFGQVVVLDKHLLCELKNGLLASTSPSFTQHVPRFLFLKLSLIALCLQDITHISENGNF